MKPENCLVCLCAELFVDRSYEENASSLNPEEAFLTSWDQKLPCEDPTLAESKCTTMWTERYQPA